MTQDKIDIAIQAFIRSLIENPYLHRCEHSLHIGLYDELLKQASKSLSLKLNNLTFKTSIVHKEFPGRKKTDTSINTMVDRTQIDIVILTENQSTDAINDFLEGNLEIDYAFELSLEYNIEHLCWDIFKFISGSNRSVNHKNYILHLYNKNRIKTYFDDNKVNSISMWNSNLEVVEKALNKEFEWCYYLVNLCLKFSKEQDVDSYNKILKIVIYFVTKRNAKYANSYLLTEDLIKAILMNMKFVLIDLNPNSNDKNKIKLQNIFSKTQDISDNLN